MAACWSDAENMLFAMVVRDVESGGQVATNSRVYARYNAMVRAPIEVKKVTGLGRGRAGTKTISQVEGKLRRHRQRTCDGGVHKPPPAAKRQRPAGRIAIHVPVDICLVAAPVEQTVDPEPEAAVASTADTVPDPDKLFDNDDEFDLWLQELEGFLEMDGGLSTSWGAAPSANPTTPLQASTPSEECYNAP